MKNIIRIPKVYYDDHIQCECEAPPIVRETKSHYFISGEEVRHSQEPGMSTLDDLYTRAKTYEDQRYHDSDYWGLCRSAKATIIAIDKYRIRSVIV